MLSRAEWIEDTPEVQPQPEFERQPNRPTPVSTPLLIGEAKTEEQRQEVFRLRYKVYIEEMARGCRADHQNKKIEDELDPTGVLITAHANGRLVGTCRANFSTNCNFEHRELYDFDQFEKMFPRAVMFTTKLMVLPEYRKGTLFLKLCKKIYETGLQRGAFVMVIDCNDHLVKSFSALGFQHYKGKAQHPDYGMVNPMVLYNHDARHLQAIRSPFFPILRKHISAVSDSTVSLNTSNEETVRDL